MAGSSNRGDDEISVTSSIDELPDDEVAYTVEDVLVKAWSDYHRDQRYLVQWAGYPMHEWTWEPVEEQGEGVHDMWRARQERVKRGEVTEFDPVMWIKAQRAFLQGKLARYSRRNMKRRRLGLSRSENHLKEELDDLALFPGGSRPSVTISESEGDDSDNDVFESLSRRTQKRRSLSDMSDRPSKVQKQADGQKPSRSAKAAAMANISVAAASEYSAAPISQKPSGQVQSRKRVVPKPITTTNVIVTKIKDRQDVPVVKASRAASKPPNSIEKPSPVTPTSASSNRVNVFAGGREKRVRKQPDAINPERASAHFANFQTMHKYAKRTKWKEDAEPRGQIVLRRVSNPIEMLNLTTVVAADAPPPMAETPFSALYPEVRPEGSILRRMSKESAVQDDPKQVRFEREESLCQTRLLYAEPEYVDEGDDLFVGQSDSNIICSNPVDSDSQVPVFDELVTKNATFGDKDAANLACVFDRITLYKPDDPWLGQFQTQDVLSFTHTCQAMALKPLYHAIRTRTVVTGHIFAHDDKDMLRNVAEHLKIGSFGAVCFFANSAIIAYPARDKEWADIEPHFFAGLDEEVRRAIERRDGALDDPDDDDEMINNKLTKKVIRGYSEPSAFLKFAAFVVNDGFQSITVPPAEAGRLDGWAQIPQGPRPYMMDLFFKLKYETLLPQGIADDVERHTFFVSVPPLSSQPLLKSFLLWLESCNSQAQLYMSHMDGHWAAFAERKSGVVVVHQTILRLIAQYPGFDKLLNTPSTQFRFWVLAPPPDHKPLDLYGSKRLDHGPFSIKEVFVGGDVFLLTPSFLASQPNAAIRFFDWFRQHANTSKDSKDSWALAVPKNLDQFLFHLASQQDQAMLADKWRKDLDDQYQARWDMLAVFRKLSEEDPAAYTFIANEYTPALFVHIDDYVNVYDEQSLVNWFGAWSLANIHRNRFRRFHVVGSKEAPTGWNVTIPIPHYFPDTQNDPDLLTLPHLELLRPATFPKSGDDEGESAALVFTPGPTADPRTLRALLNNLEPIYKNSLLFLNHNPIGYPDMYAAEKLRDPHSEVLETYANWFKFYKPNSMRHTGKNTYAGLFFTCPENSASSRYGDYSGWRPWVAFFRPGIYPGRSSNRALNHCELILWDPQADQYARNANAAVQYSVLPLEMRQLIDLVDEEIPNRHFLNQNGKPVLRYVYLGGLTREKSTSKSKKSGEDDNNMLTLDPTLSPLERTARFMQKVAEDTRLWLPLPHNTMLSRGFVTVGNDANAAIPTEPVAMRDASSPSKPTAREASPVEETPDVQGVFGDPGGPFPLYGISHPPMRTDIDSLARPSRCKNLLFKAAVKARRRQHPLARDENMMTFTYPSTLEWWQTQKSEGRHFEHLNLDTVDGIMNLVDGVRKKK